MYLGILQEKKAPNDEPPKGALPPLSDADREAQLLKDKGAKVAPEKRGTQADPSVAYLKELQSDAKYVLDTHKAKTLGEQLDVLTERLRSLGDKADLEKEHLRARTIRAMKVTDEQKEKRGSEITSSVEALTKAEKVFEEARMLLSGGKKDAAADKFKEGEALLETSIRALYPDEKKKIEPKKDSK